MSLSMHMSSNVVFNDQTFPDEKFRTYLKENFSSRGFTEEGVSISSENLASIYTIDVRAKGITSLKGIEWFTSLTTLYCNGNFGLSALDVSNNTELRTLVCTQSPIGVLDLSANNYITQLQCSQCGLDELNVSNLANLTTLRCDNNNLTSLDLSNNASLSVLYCHNNRITALDLSNNRALTELYCMVNKLTQLDLTNNVNLKRLDCNANTDLVSIDVTKCPELTFLNCFNCDLPTIDVSKNLKLAGLGIQGNELTELDVSKNTELTTLVCYMNHLTELDLTGLTKLSFVPGTSSYHSQTRELVAECFEKTQPNESTPRRYYYFRLDNLKHDEGEKNIFDRMDMTSNGRTETKFTRSRVIEFKSGCKEIIGALQRRVKVAEGEITSDDVVGDIILLTDYTVSENVARGTFTYTYDINFEGSKGTDPKSEFTINWTCDATPGVITGLVRLPEDSSPISGTTYVNMMGNMSSQPWPGMNIVVNHHEDGTTTVNRMVHGGL